MNTDYTINSFRDEFFFLSNFYECPITYQGITYRNTESAFQAMKCKDVEDRKRFTTLSATEAKKLGRKISLRSDWEDIKVQEMRNIVRCKFEQNPELKQKLMKLKDFYLEEGNTWGDRIWGTVHGQGANLLGRILMETRDDFLQQEIEDMEEDIDIVE